MSDILYFIAILFVLFGGVTVVHIFTYRNIDAKWKFFIDHVKDYEYDSTTTINNEPVYVFKDKAGEYEIYIWQDNNYANVLKLNEPDNFYLTKYDGVFGDLFSKRLGKKLLKKIR